MKNELIDKILEELDKARQLLVKCKETGKVPDIERDIIMGKLRNMYEFIQFAQSEKIEDDLPEQVETTIEPEPSVIQEESQSNTIEFDTVKEEKVVVEEKITVTEKKTEEPSPVKQTTVDVKVHANGQPEILADKFQNKSFLNEALSQLQNVSDVSKRVQNQPIKDIFSAINLNDKFILIKELFHNDTALYQSTVEKLNNAGNFNDAVRYLDGNFAWDFADPLVQNFLELVRRRFL